MRSGLAGAFLSVTTLLTSVASATDANAPAVDVDAGLAAPDHALDESAPVVDVRLEHGHAAISVRQTIVNPHGTAVQARLSVPVPPTAVATRFRMAASGPRGALVWSEAELLGANVANEAFARGGKSTRSAAILAWEGRDALSLLVDPVPAHGSRTFEVTFRIPLTYAEGRWGMTLPAFGTEVRRPTIRLVAAVPGDVVELDGKWFAGETTVTASRELDVHLRATTKRPLEGGLASVPTGDRHLVHTRVDAGTLSQVPARAAIAVVLDTSHSMVDAFDAEVAAARAYLQSFPSADVDILTFDRAVHTPFGGTMSVAQAIARLSPSGFVPGNGSNVDAAVARADALLARSGITERRMLILTDLRTKAAIDPELLARRSMASHAIVHVARVSAGGPSVFRDDENAWAKLPRATGGLLWQAHANPDDPAGAKRVFEEWARPTRIDGLVLGGLPPDWGAPAALAEGEGIAHVYLNGGAVARVTVEGELWSRPFRWSMKASEDEGNRWAGLVFGTEIESELTEAEQLALATRGRAVSPVTSYLVTGATPTESPGSPGGSGGVSLGGKSTSCCICGLGTSGGAGLDREAYLAAVVDEAATACSAPGDVRAVLETTRVEIVDVRDVVAPGVEACVSDYLWSIALPDAFHEDHQVYAVARPTP